jgi:colanic acid/amylovoran biosynthesis glycosyltransferase
VNLNVAYIFIRYPVLSQQFLQREIGALTAQGISVKIFSLFPVAPAERSERVNYFRWWEAIKLLWALPRELGRDPALLGDGWKILKRHWPKTAENFWTTIWAVVFAVCRAQEFRRSGVQVVHGAWATAPATAAAILHRLCQIPFSFGADAYDIYRHGGDAFLEPKLREAAFVHTNTHMTATHLRGVSPESADKIVLGRRGLEKFPALIEEKDLSQPLRILSVARLVEKKGHRHQLAACDELKKLGIDFELRLVGDGPARVRLAEETARRHLHDRVNFCGALSPEKTSEAYEWASVFWHTGIIDADGDRDGLPNVIPEAFSHGLAVISHRAPAAMEAVIDGETGLLVEAGDSAALAKATERLMKDSALRHRLGANGRRWVEENFRADTNTKILAAAFRNATKPASPSESPAA